MSDFRSELGNKADCISNCTACESICLETLAHCHVKGGALAKPKLLSMLAVCAEVCALSARTMQRGSEAHVFICSAASQVCQRCAEMCGAYSDDALMRACASACTMTSRCCGEMASMPVFVAEELHRRAS